MKISNEILYEVIESMPLVPPEAGGILGGKEGRICLWKYDAGYPETGCAYRPNVNFLNRVIAEWNDSNYDFMGIFHVHFGGSKTLSNGDKRYIEEIMRAMPDFVERLYFPIVVQPEKQFISYLAYRGSSDRVTITTDKFEVLI